MPTARATSGESAGGADNLQTVPQGHGALQNRRDVINATFLKQALIKKAQIGLI